MQTGWLHRSTESNEGGKVPSDVNKENEREGKKKARRRRKRRRGGRQRPETKEATASLTRGGEHNKCNMEEKWERRRGGRERGERGEQEWSWWLSVEQVGRRH